MNSLAWAGRELIVVGGSSAILPLRQGPFAYSSPGKSRRLPLGNITALSPDGRLAVGAWKPKGSDAGDQEIRVVNLARAEVEARLRLHPNRPRKLESFGDGGVWIGDRIVATSGFADRTRLVVLRFDTERLVIEHLLGLEVPPDLRGRTAFLYAPLFLDRAGTRVLVRGDFLERAKDARVSLFLTSDLQSSQCVRGKTLRLRPRRILSILASPSRPWPDPRGFLVRLP